MSPGLSDYRPVQMQRTSALFFIVLGFLALIPRMEMPEKMLSGIYLWAEDGAVFLNNALHKGWDGVFETYAGYLHLYPKLVALLANQFEIDWRPAIMFSGWLAAYGVLLWSMVAVARRYAFSNWWAIIFVLLVAFQPSDGDVLFNATNAQWMLGASMLFMLVADHQAGFFRKILVFSAVSIFALTGPFSIFLVPFVVVDSLTRRTWKDRGYLYLPILLGGVVQLYNMLSTGRASYLSTTEDKLQLVQAFFYLFFFSFDSFHVLVAAVAFWVVALYLLVNSSAQTRRDLYYIFGYMVVVLAASVYAVRNAPLAAVNFGSGSRYTWIPYTMAIAGIMVAAWRRGWMVKGLLLSCLLIVFVSGFKQSRYFDLNYQYFSHYARYKEINIPINPAGIHSISGIPRVRKDSDQLIETKLSAEVGDSHQVIHRADGSYAAEGGDPYVVLSSRMACSGKKYALVEMELTRSSEGLVQLFWRSDKGFSEAASLKRYYPGGIVTAQFAFPVGDEPFWIRLDPFEGKGDFSFRNVALTCYD